MIAFHATSLSLAAKIARDGMPIGAYVHPRRDRISGYSHRAASREPGGVPVIITLEIMPESVEPSPESRSLFGDPHELIAVRPIPAAAVLDVEDDERAARFAATLDRFRQVFG